MLGTSPRGPWASVDGHDAPYPWVNCTLLIGCTSDFWDCEK